MSKFSQQQRGESKEIVRKERNNKKKRSLSKTPRESKRISRRDLREMI